mmetsp:Transcript_1873/g.5293  ORF Transcript_1873/g.5293 Transcript_1873/m.5293 type:complete len:232 (+) Transcript_1873:258-953(+)
MGVTNLDGSEYDSHVKQVAEYAMDIVRAASRVLIDEDDPSLGYVQTRVGFHSGPVVSNVIGTLNPRYGLFGDTVNTASRMQSNAMPGKVHCSFASAQLLQQQAPDIPVELRGMIKVKGKGKMKTYWVGGDDLTRVSPPNSIFVCNEASESHQEDGSVTDHVDNLDPETTSPPNRSMQAKTHLPKTSSSFSGNGKDHFIGVHSSDSGSRSNQAILGMDGKVQRPSKKPTPKQ